MPKTKVSHETCQSLFHLCMNLLSVVEVTYFYDHIILVIFTYDDLRILQAGAVLHGVPLVGGHWAEMVASRTRQRAQHKAV